MAMLAWGPAEILMLLLMSGAGQPTDLTSLMSPRDYFQFRKIDVTIEKMVELAGQDPKDGKTQIAQLLALRHLGEDEVNFKKSASYAEARRLIEDIAAGSKAQDRLGFAKDYAAKLLNRLDGKSPSVPPMNKALRDEGLAWFPAEATIVGVIDSRMNPGNLPGPRLPIDGIMKLVPAEAKEMLYKHVEALGNIRVERVSFAYAHAGKHQGTMMARATGKMNHAWVADVLKSAGMKLQEAKGGDKDTTSIFQGAQSEPALALIGDVDFVIAGGSGREVDSRKVVDELFAVRDKKKDNVFKGALKEDLAKFPAKAAGYFVAMVPDEARDELKGPIGAVPHKIVGHLQRAATGTDFVLDASMGSDAEAKSLVQVIAKGRDSALTALKNLPESPIPGITFDSLINTLNSLQLEARGSSVNVRMLIADDTLGAIPMLFFMGNLR